MYNKLKIVQNDFGGIDVFLDGKQVKGCTEASLKLGIDAIPLLTITVMVHDVEVDLDKPIVTQKSYRG